MSMPCAAMDGAAVTAIAAESNAAAKPNDPAEPKQQEKSFQNLTAKNLMEGLYPTTRSPAHRFRHPATAEPAAATQPIEKGRSRRAPQQGATSSAAEKLSF
jgi:hypothetical protein